MVKYNLADTSAANRSILRGHCAGAKEKVLPHILLQVKTGAFDRKKDYIPQVCACARILTEQAVQSIIISNVVAR